MSSDVPRCGRAPWHASRQDGGTCSTRRRYRRRGGIVTGERFEASLAFVLKWEGSSYHFAPELPGRLGRQARTGHRAGLCAEHDGRGAAQRRCPRLCRPYRVPAPTGRPRRNRPRRTRSQRPHPRIAQRRRHEHAALNQDGLAGARRRLPAHAAQGMTLTPT